MNLRILQSRVALLFAASALLALAAPARVSAQFGPPPPAAKPPNPRLIAPQDFTGYWVSIITEDWRYRMITADKGEYGGVPLTQQGHALAEAWDPAKDAADGNQCRAYGAAGLMRMPTRLLARCRAIRRTARTKRFPPAGRSKAGRSGRPLPFLQTPSW